MNPGDWAAMATALAWVAAELLVPHLMGTRRRPAARGSGRMAVRPFPPPADRDPRHRW